MPTTPTPGAMRAANKICSSINPHPAWEESACIIDEETHAGELLEALRFQVSWIMRDGSPCCCPAGKNEDEPKGKMPTVHSTACEMLRAAIASATKE